MLFGCGKTGLNFFFADKRKVSKVENLKFRTRYFFLSTFFGKKSEIKKRDTSAVLHFLKFSGISNFVVSLVSSIPNLGLIMKIK